MAKVRDSNIELYRIFLMVVLIMPCHYIMSSGAIGLVDSSHLTFNMYLAEFFSRTGRMGNNCFLLITGYFMCRHNFTWLKFSKIFLQVTFYAVTIYLLFVLFSRAEFSIRSLYAYLFSIPKGIGSDFIGSFMAVYLLSPFLNKLIDALDPRGLRNLIITLVAIFSVCYTMTGSPKFDMVGWYITVYLTGAYLRICPPHFLNTRKNVNLFLILNLLIVFGSILGITFLSQYKPGVLSFAQISIEQSNYIMSYSCAIAFFLFFKNIKMPNSTIINTIATATLGVLCIHEHSREMHHFLYRDLFNVKEHFTSGWFPLYMAGCVILTYLTCVAIDLIRQRFLERPLFNAIEKIIKKRNNTTL